MPMLMTLRMRLPVWPFHAPLRTRLEKSAILSSTAWTWGTTFSPSTTIDAPRRAQGHVQDGPVLRDVDLLAAEHGVDPRSQAGFLRQLQEELEGLVGDAILRVIEEDAHGLGRHPLAALGIIREELPQVQFPDCLMVGASRAFQAGRAVSNCVACRHLGIPLVAIWLPGTQSLPASNVCHHSLPPRGEILPGTHWRCRRLGNREAALSVS